MANLNKKKLLFYSIMATGHLNVCVSLSKIILDNHEDEIDIYFICDSNWQKKLKQMDKRFKFGIIEYDSSDTHSRIQNIVSNLEESLEMPVFEKLITTWNGFSKDPTLFEVDKKAEEQIRKINPDFLMADQAKNLPAIYNTGIPFAYIMSLNPLIFSAEGLPRLGSGLKANNKKEIELFEKKFAPFKKEFQNDLYKLFERRGVKFDRKDAEIDVIKSDHFYVYCYPSELDYFTEDFKIKNNLIQIDSALFPSRIPEAFKLPEEFKKINLPLIYVSLGSLFSSYTDKLQKLIDILANLPYKYIFSKGPNGDQITFPNNRFIGENFIDQLAVLQIADAMIYHGGNNTLCESFYFGVPCVVIGLILDQISNMVRIEEMNYGYQINILELNEKEISEKLDKILNDNELKSRLRKASQRIQKENKITKVSEYIFDYIKNKL